MLFNEEDLFNGALKAIRGNFAPVVPIHVDVIGTDLNPAQGTYFDRLIKLTIGENQIQYYAEMKRDLTRANVGILILHRKLIPGPLMLIANYVNDVMAEYLRENNIEFIDTAGNAYINQPPVYIYIKGNKPKNKYMDVPTGQAFRPTGLKVVFALLCNPQIIKTNYRAIAQAAGVALGNIGWIIKDLKKQGFLVDMGRQGCKLVQKKGLLDRFVEEYPKKLRQQMFLGRFKGARDWWRNMDLACEQAFWGGETAAAKLANYIKPQTITLYLKQDLLNDFLLKYRLKRDAAGDVEILKVFWEPAEITEKIGLVHPILIYADLVATLNQRDIEAAKEIYERHILRFIRED